MKNACMDCTRRTLGCHSRCEEYKAYREKMDRIREARAKERSAVEASVDGYESWRKDMLNRRGRRRGKC